MRYEKRIKFIHSEEARKELEEAIQAEIDAELDFEIKMNKIFKKIQSPEVKDLLDKIFHPHPMPTKAPNKEVSVSDWFDNKLNS